MANTYFKEAGPTLYGPTGSASCIDHVLLEIVNLVRIQSLRIPWRDARKLQLIPSKRPGDHAPLLLDVDVELNYEKMQEEKAVRWDNDKLARVAQIGDVAEEFHKDLKVAYEGNREEFGKARAVASPDEHWQ